MTVQEIQTMIRQNMVLYRNVAKPLTDKEADLLIATWADALSDVPSAAGNEKGIHQVDTLKKEAPGSSELPSATHTRKSVIRWKANTV